MEKRGRNLSSVLMTLASYALAIVFFTSAVAKVVSPSSFTSFVSSISPEFFGSSGLSVVHPVVLLYAVALIELAIAILLLIHSTRSLGGIASCGLLLLFSGIIMYASEAANSDACGCFGDLLPQVSSKFLVLRNSVLFLIALYVTRYPGSKYSEG